MSSIPSSVSDLSPRARDNREFIRSKYLHEPLSTVRNMRDAAIRRRDAFRATCLEEMVLECIDAGVDCASQRPMFSTRPENWTEAAESVEIWID